MVFNVQSSQQHQQERERRDSVPERIAPKYLIKTNS